jgi:hypothetical protein
MIQILLNSLILLTFVSETVQSEYIGNSLENNTNVSKTYFFLM